MVLGYICHIYVYVYVYVYIYVSYVKLYINDLLKVLYFPPNLLIYNVQIQNCKIPI